MCDFPFPPSSFLFSSLPHALHFFSLSPSPISGIYRAQYYSSVSSLNIRLVIPGLVGKMLHDKKIESKHGSGKVMRGLKGEQYGIS